MKFGVLGPLLVHGDDREIRLNGPRQAKVLAGLLLRPNSAVALSSLVDAMWDGDAPATAVRQIQDAISGLRRNLGDTDPKRRLIDTLGSGYRINLSVPELDLLEFDAYLQRAQECQAGAELPQAAAALRAALGCWRGPALDGLASRALAAGAEQLHARRVATYRQLMTIEISLHRHQEIVDELLALIQAQPFDEGLAQQGMLALYRCGRRADALALFHELRGVLAEELGVEPGRQVRDLHLQILREDPEIGVLGPVSGGSQAARPVSAANVPMQLPADNRTFTGRTDELGRLIALAQEATASSSSAPDTAVRGAVMISAINGMAGVGKTTLAVHAGHRLREQFPDGQLFLDLHGFTPGIEPVTAASALEFLLRSLGTALEAIPDGLDARAAAYRRRLSGSRVLIVLDNAAGAAQIRPLLPDSDGCLVLVTSRRRLTGLDAAHFVALDVLDEQEALALLRAAAGGPGRIPDGHPAAAELVALCGCVPLAIRITAARLRHHRTLEIGEVVEQLRDGHRRLENLAEEGDRGLNVALASSYTALTATEQRFFRLLALIPGTDFDVHAVATLADLDYRESERLLESMLDHSLLLEHNAGRYRFHDLVRLFAQAELSRTPIDGQDGALHRLFDYYEHVAGSTNVHLAVLSRPARPTRFTPVSAPPLRTRAQSLAWMRAERDNLLAALAFAADTHSDARVVSMTASVAEFLRVDGPWAAALTLHQAAATRSKELGDGLAEANATYDLATMARLTGDEHLSIGLNQQALILYQGLGVRLGEANALEQLGRVEFEHGNYADAIGMCTRALDIFRAEGDRPGQGEALVVIGRALDARGDVVEGIRSIQEARDIYRASGDRVGEANADWTLARRANAEGRYEDAANLLGEALAVYQEYDLRFGEASTLSELGRVWRNQKEYDRAAEVYDRVLTIYQEIGHRFGVATAYSALGALHGRTGDYAASAQSYERALPCYRDMGHPHGEADALHGLGLARRAAGDTQAAADVFQQSLGIYEAIEHRQGQAEVLNAIGALTVQVDGPGAALPYYERALVLAREAHSSQDEAQAREGIALCSAP